MESPDEVRCGGFGHPGAASAVLGPAAPPLSARGSCHRARRQRGGSARWVGRGHWDPQVEDLEEECSF